MKKPKVIDADEHQGYVQEIEMMEAEYRSAVKTVREFPRQIREYRQFLKKFKPAKEGDNKPWTA